MTLCWRQSTDFINFFKVIQVLDVAAIVPSKHIRFFAVDQVRHRGDPGWVLDGLESSILGILHNLEDVTTFERVTVITDRTRDRLKLAASLAFLGR